MGLQFRDVPLYVVCESYGGKMGAEFAQAIVSAQEDFKVDFGCVSVSDAPPILLTFAGQEVASDQTYKSDMSWRSSYGANPFSG